MNNAFFIRQLYLIDTLKIGRCGRLVKKMRFVRLTGHNDQLVQPENIIILEDVGKYPIETFNKILLVSTPG